MKDNQAKYPQLRFKGFTDPWEQRKLGEIAIRVRGNDGRMNLPTLTISAGNGWMDQRDRFSQNIAGKEQKNYTLLRQGELSYNHGNSKLAQFGAVFELESYNEALVPRVYHSFSVTAGAQPKFIEQMFATHRPDRELRKLVSSGARMDGLLNINYDDFMGIKVWLPSVAEQQAIAGLLVKLDNTIDLHQRKLAKLKELKQGYLQKLFPRNGSKFPQLRFAGFADAWEQRKFEYLLDENDGIRRGPFGSALKKECFVSQSDYVVYEQQNAIYNKYETRYNITKDKFEELKKFELKPEDFIMSGAGTIGRISRVPHGIDKGVFNQALIRFRIDNRITDSEYFLQFIRADFMQKKLTSTNPGSAITNLVPMSEVKKWGILVPQINEQSKIGIFLKQLDKTIALHQRKLEKLQELKKGHLQKMFC